MLNTTNNLTFSVDGLKWTIHGTRYLHPYGVDGGGWEAVASGSWNADEDYSCYLYHQVSSIVSTSPSCETYDIVWKVDGTPTSAGSPTEETTTCTGIEDLPTDPDDDELDCSSIFMGWSEHELVGAGHDNPGDLFTTVGDAPVIDEDKTFYAVFASDDTENETPTNITSAFTDKSWSDENSLWTSGADGYGYVNSGVQLISSTTAYATTKASYYKVDSVEVTYCTNGSAGAGGIKIEVGTTKIDSIGVAYSSGTGTDSKTIKFKSASLPLTGAVKIHAKGQTNSVYIQSVKIYYRNHAYKNYTTTCCDNSITIGSPSITGSGTVTFTLGGEAISAGDEVETCTSAKDVVSTVTPASGYSCTALTFTGGSVSVDPTPGAGNYPSAPSSQDYTLSFAKKTTAATLATSATFTAKPLTAWAWKYKKDADAADGSVAPYDIPDVVDLYVGQYARFIITGYTPSDVIADKQGFVYVSSDDPAVMQPVLDKTKITYVSKDASNTYYQVKGKAATESTTITIKATGDGSITKTVTIRVKALPTVTFEDLIHNKTDFANSGDGWNAGTGVLSSTASNVGVVSHTKKTPTHTDVAAPGTGNDCEKGHLHLMGWIRSDYPALVAYMNGTGARPEYSAIISAGNDDSDKVYFLEPNASINVEDFNGKTFYAVWATIE